MWQNEEHNSLATKHNRRLFPACWWGAQGSLDGLRNATAAPQQKKKNFFEGKLFYFAERLKQKVEIAKIEHNVNKFVSYICFSESIKNEKSANKKIYKTKTWRKQNKIKI